MRRSLRALLLVALLALAGGALAFDPGDGTEAVLTDPGGQRLIGYGVVQGGVLVLRLGERADRFVLLLLAPDGQVRTLDGIQGGGGTLIVTDADGARVPLSSLLGRSNVMLRVVRGASGAPRAGDTGPGGSDDPSDDGSADDGGGSGGGTPPEDGSGEDPPGTDDGAMDPSRAPVRAPGEGDGAP